jgi:SAM-dependent methyltransferase
VVGSARRRKAAPRRALLWVRFHDEAVACPACASPRIVLLDVIPRVGDTHGRLVSFVTGCRDCGVLFANPLRSQTELDRYYGDRGHWAQVFEARVQRGAQRARARDQQKNGRRLSGRDRILLALEPYVPVSRPPAGAKVLDFGCGDGKFLDKLKLLGWETYGIEPAMSTAFPNHYRLDEPPQDASVDFVLLNHVLEHVPEPLALLRRLAGAMREGGTLFISLPRLDTLPQHGQFKYCLDGRKHLAAYSETCLTGLLARAGFVHTARLDAADLDEAMTKGQPLRLRLVATRTQAPPPLPLEPLAPAVRALREYRRTPAGFLGPVERVWPVRLRAALMARARRRARA